MNIEEIENRIKICEKRAMEYREVGKSRIADKYDEEKYKWEKLLSSLELLNERKINELLDYKKGYYHQKQVIDKIEELLIIKKARCLNEDDYALKVLDLDDILDILKQVSK